MAVLLHLREKQKLNSFMSKKDKFKEALIDEEIQTNEDNNDGDLSSKAGYKVDVATQLKKDLDAEKDRYLRLFAEFENYKKRTGRERIELFRTASQEVMVSLLPVMDDFDRAFKEIERENMVNNDLFIGVELISNKLRETLRIKGLEAIETKKGDVFDPEIHEAVTQIPAPEDGLKGKIIDVLEKGYTLGEKVIRYPKVVIGQ